MSLWLARADVVWGKLKTTPRRKEDSDWMHDPGGKNRFSKLSNVERTASALFARQKTTLSLFLSLSLPLSFSDPFRIMANQEVPMTTFLGKYKGKANIPFRGICPFHLPRDIFRPYEQKSCRKLYRVYIARWTSTMLLVVTKIRPTKLLPRPFSTNRWIWCRKARSRKRFQAEFPDGELAVRVVILGESGFLLHVRRSGSISARSLSWFLIVSRTDKSLTNCPTGSCPLARSANTIRWYSSLNRRP